VPRDLDRKLAKQLEPLIEPLGFEYLGGANFGRQRGCCRDVLFWNPVRFRKDAVTVVVGINVPALDDALKTAGVGELALTVSRHLGSKRPGASDFQTVYEFVPPRSLGDVATELAQDVRDVAIPWFDGYLDLTSLAAGYYETEVKRRIAPGAPKPNPVTILVYALLLREVGQSTESQNWCARVREILLDRGNGTISKADEPLLQVLRSL